MIQSLATLKPGYSGVIAGFDDAEISLKLIELGCIPGTPVTMVRKAPLGDPVAFYCSGSLISIRMQEAQTVQIEV
jgi:ferrous iron transport protein A